MVGRFTSVDPVKDGLNWYAYCAGNPVKYVDPSGESPLLIIAIAAFTITFSSVAILSPSSSEIINDAELHYSRNKLNISDKSVEEIIKEYDLQSEIADQYHEYTDSKQGEDAKYNNKYLSPNGGYKEIIISFPPNEEPYIVDEHVDEKNMGTYNYARNDQFFLFYWAEHFAKDMWPYYLYGNTENDGKGFFKPIIKLNLGGSAG